MYAVTPRQDWTTDREGNEITEDAEVTINALDCPAGYGIVQICYIYTIDILGDDGAYYTLHVDDVTLR